MPRNQSRRVVVVSPMPPEKSAYALARYSRSPDSIFQSLEWVRSHDSQSFLEHYYFQYGHASIADLGHAIFCLEGISELAAVEIEDEPLWDGQAKSSRYQDFSTGGVIVPPDLAGTPAESVYTEAAKALLDAYLELHKKVLECLMERHPRPEAMKPEPYRRTLAARAFDVARYLLFLGIPTNIGQVTSIRTLEKQMRRLGASRYPEVREIASAMGEACAAPPACVWDAATAQEPLAPTLARHASPDLYAQQARRNVAAWAAQNFPCPPAPALASVDLIRPVEPVDEIVATLLYAVTHVPFRAVYEQVSCWGEARKREVIDVALQGRPGPDDLLREFRSGYS
ncbi:MAG TPA: FAD-dependent thymidylate synthase, partial [Bryobacterales bacterium]|nr:FAD-dependent thymidylate synthase [Bryobacterales bacterium]